MDGARDRGGTSGVGDLDGTVVALAELMSRRRGGRLITCAETFTGGLLNRAMAAADPAGSWFAGGVVAPRVEQRRRVLRVRSPDDVSEGCAVQMALGVVELFGTTASVAVTGHSGPGTAHGRPAGTVIVGWVVDGEWGATTLELPGTPRQLQLRAVRTALTSLSRAMTDADDPRVVG